MKKVLLLAITFAAVSCTDRHTRLHDYPVSAVGIRNVTLTDSFWQPVIRLIRDSTVKYAFDKCNREGRMDNFLIAGKVKEGKVKGKMPFDDTDLYKIIEGASLSLISVPDPVLEAYLDSMIEIIRTGQEEDGYLTTWFTIDPLHPPAAWVKPSETRWENEISSHELYNSGHLFEAATAHYTATGKRNLLDIALKNADLLVENFRPDKLHIPPGHQIVETGLVKLYRITGNTDYVELAKYFLDLRGDSISHPLYGEYYQDHLPVTEQGEAIGHAVRAEYMYAGMTDIAAIFQDSSYFRAVGKIWDNIVAHKMYLTGGVGARHEGEAFGDNDELPNLTAYNETCAAIGSISWNHRMFLLTGDSKYYDIIERTLYNGLISGLSLDGKKFFYPNPLESDGEYPFNMGACTRQSWFDCSCCPTNLIRFVPSIPGLIYATHSDTLFINLYISGDATININDTEVDVIQQSDYPWDGKIFFYVSPGKKKAFTLKLRVPGWARNEPFPGDLYTYADNDNLPPGIWINGNAVKSELRNGYLSITRTWEQGDKVELDLPMKAHRVKAAGRIQDDRNKVAFERGPIVYCEEEADNLRISELAIPKSVTLQTEEKNILSKQVKVLTGTTEGISFTLIPYFLWSNRGPGKMEVWMAESGDLLIK